MLKSEKTLHKKTMYYIPKGGMEFYLCRGLPTICFFLIITRIVNDNTLRYITNGVLANEDVNVSFFIVE